MARKLSYAIIILLFTGFFSLQADEDNVTDVFDLSLEELLHTKISVATKKATNIRETPSIVSSISKEEIINSGARDLIDVLTLLVPGFNFGVDVEGQVGVGLRGLWGYEGKILIMLDGQELNEEMFGVNVFGNHYPVDMIEKIEIIRGPGSSIYGGYAELGVINIITKKPEAGKRFVSFLWSQMKNTPSHRDLTFGYTTRFNDLEISAVGVIGEGNRSDKDNLDYYGNLFPMKNNSELNSTIFNVNITYKKLDFRAIVDRYHVTQIDLWGENYTRGALNEDFKSTFLQLKYDFKPTDNLSLTPFAKLKVQLPWQLVAWDLGYTNRKRAEKISGGVSGLWDISNKTSLAFGVEYYSNYLYMPDNPSPFEDSDGDGLFRNGEDRLGFSNFSAYGQLMVHTNVVNLTVGGRLDYSKKYEASFVPRIGLTKAWKSFHIKAMISQSFRMPAGILPDRVATGSSYAKPEKATIYEIELGAKITDKIYWTVNGYDMKIDKVIIYASDPVTGAGVYTNFGKIGTRGIESELRYMGKVVSMNLNYAFYKSSKNEVELYQVPTSKDAFLGFPQQRLNAIMSVKLGKMLSVHPTLSWFGKRYGFISYDGDTDTHRLKEFSPTSIFSINSRIKDFPFKGIEVDLGIFNIFNSEFSYIQPYKGWHSPLPSLSRSAVLRVIFSI